MRVLLYITLILFSGGTAHAQDNRKRPLIPGKDYILDPFDHYGNVAWEDEMARLDNFAVAIHNDPQMIGYIIVFGSKNGCEGEAQRRAVRAKKYLVERRGVDWNRIIWLDAGYLDEAEVFLEGQVRGATPYPFEHPKPVALSEVKLNRCSVRIIRHTRRAPKRGRA